MISKIYFVQRITNGIDINSVFLHKAGKTSFLIDARSGTEELMLVPQNTRNVRLTYSGDYVLKCTTSSLWNYYCFLLLSLKYVYVSGQL